MSRTNWKHLAAAALAVAVAGGAVEAAASDNSCAQPISSGPDPVASDCLYILRAAVQTVTCTDPCICQPKGTGPTRATDALVCLQFSVGQPVTLNCPCGTPDIESSEFTFDPDTAIADANVAARFEKTRYYGAFSQDQGRTIADWTEDWTVKVHGNNKVWHPATAGTLNGAEPAADGTCPAGTTDIGDTNMPAPYTGSMDICQLALRYNTPGETVTLTNDNVYRINDNPNGGTFFGDGDSTLKTRTATVGYTVPVTTHLVIEQGTLVIGGSAQAVIITRGSDIDVNGTRENPVVMDSVTAFNAWVGGNDDGGIRGQWSGLVLTGFGEFNRCNDGTSCDFVAEGLAATVYAGGESTDWDCGDLDYLVIDNPGFDIDGLGNDTNGLTVYGCDYPTTISYVQVNNSRDDAFEFFGGTAVADHVVATRNQDDNFDADYGFRGGVQFGLAIQASDRGDKGFELDNGKNGDAVYQTATPVTLPNFANITVINSATSNASDNTLGIGLRTWTGVNMWNVIQENGEVNGARSEEATGSYSGTAGDDILTFNNVWMYNPTATAETTSNGMLRGSASPSPLTDFTADADKSNLAATLAAGSNNIVDRTSDPGIDAGGFPNSLVP